MVKLPMGVALRDIVLYGGRLVAAIATNAFARTTTNKDESPIIGSISPSMGLRK
jgi:hypothetical protein